MSSPTADRPSSAPELPRRAVRVLPSGPVRAALAAPTSKSVTNRVLLTAALAEGDSVLRSPLLSDDSRAMLAAVEAFGAEVDVDGEVWRVRGTAGRPRTPDSDVHAGLSGTTMRFVAALATLAPGPSRVTGEPALLRRPIGPLVDALSELGARIRARDGRPPVEADGGGLRGGAVSVDAGGSSQFASAVLLVAPYARRDVRMRVAGVGARAYIELTAATMRRWQAEVVDRDDGWLVAAGAPYRAREDTVEYDASAAAHLLAVAAASGGTVTVTNAAADSLQPDAALPEVLGMMGADVRRDGSSVTVSGPERLRAVDVDLSAMPDQVTTVAALAAIAEGRSTITGVAVTRGHETDRLAALAGELGKAGVRVDERPDGLVVHGAAGLRPARLATHDDHRLAMAFAALGAGARAGGVVVEQPWCVSKTYPGFWVDLERIGVRWREEPDDWSGR